MTTQSRLSNEIKGVCVCVCEPDRLHLPAVCTCSLPRILSLVLSPSSHPTQTHFIYLYPKVYQSAAWLWYMISYAFNGAGICPMKLVQHGHYLASLILRKTII